MSGALHKSVFDGNTILLKMSGEYGRHRYTYIGGEVICHTLTNDDIHNKIPNMGNNLTPYGVAIGEENIYFLNPHFKFIKRDKIDDNELLSTNEDCVDPFKYHVLNCGKDWFKKSQDIKFIRIMIKN